MHYQYWVCYAHAYTAIYAVLFQGWYTIAIFRIKICTKQRELTRSSKCYVRVCRAARVLDIWVSKRTISACFVLSICWCLIACTGLVRYSSTTWHKCNSIVYYMLEKPHLKA